MAKVRKKLGQILISDGAIDDKQLQTALGMAKGAGKRLGEIMIEAGMVSEEAVAKALAKQAGLKYADLSSPEIQEAIDPSQLPQDLIKKHIILPLGKSGSKLRLLAHDPKNLELLDMLRFRLNTDIEPVIAPKSQIKGYIDQQLGGAAKASLTEDDDKPKTDSLLSASIDKSLDKSVDKSIDSSIDKAAESAPIIKLCKRIIIEAVRGRASDIHIEPMADRVRLRYRIDGVCIERDNLPKRMQNAVLARFKLMAGVNIAEKRVPQDGRIKMAVPKDNGEEDIVDFRVSACPAYHGESIVLRILRPDSVRIGLTNLGFESDNLEDQTASSSSQGPPAPEKPPPSTPHSMSSTDPTKRSSPPKTPSNTPSPASTSARSAKASGSPSHASSAPCSDRHPTSSSSARSATKKLPRSPSRPLSQDTSSSQPSTPMTRPPP